MYEYGDADGDQAYFDKYDYDVNSHCSQLHSSSTIGGVDITGNMISGGGGGGRCSSALSASHRLEYATDVSKLASLALPLPTPPPPPPPPPLPLKIKATITPTTSTTEATLKSKSSSSFDSLISSSNHNLHHQHNQTTIVATGAGAGAGAAAVATAETTSTETTRPTGSLGTDSLLFSNHHNNINNNNKKSTNTNNMNNPRNVRKRVRAQLNEQRLALLDTLLACGAGVDKYRVARVSLDMQRKLNAKSAALLAKWHALSDEIAVSSFAPTTKKQKNAIMPRSMSFGHITHHPHVDDDDDDDENHHDEPDEVEKCVGSDELKAITPLMAALCLDDADVFARLHAHERAISAYTRPDEFNELVYYAIKLQSKRCLVHLLSAHSVTTAAAADTDTPPPPESWLLLSKRHIMFYILEYTRSSRILKALVECGFDLTKREPLTGNTALHLLFAPKTRAQQRCQLRQRQQLHSGSVLDEYSSTQHGSLSKLLFVMLKRAGLRAHVNALNAQGKVSMQMLFEWSELVEMSFFVADTTTSYSSSQHTETAAAAATTTTNNDDERAAAVEALLARRARWQREFEDCVRLLLKVSSIFFFLKKSKFTKNFYFLKVSIIIYKYSSALNSRPGLITIFFLLRP